MKLHPPKSVNFYSKGQSTNWTYSRKHRREFFLLRKILHHPTLLFCLKEGRIPHYQPKVVSDWLKCTQFRITFSYQWIKWEKKNMMFNRTHMFWLIFRKYKAGRWICIILMMFPSVNWEQTSTMPAAAGAELTSWHLQRLTHMERIRILVKIRIPLPLFQHKHRWPGSLFGVVDCFRPKGLVSETSRHWSIFLVLQDLHTFKPMGLNVWPPN